MTDERKHERLSQRSTLRRLALLALLALPAKPAAADTGAALPEGLPPPDPAHLVEIAACTADTISGLACARAWEKRCWNAPPPGGYEGCILAGVSSWEVFRLQLLGRRLAEFDRNDSIRPAGSPQAGAALRAAEAAFLAFRAADCASERAAWPADSLEAPPLVADCLFRHTSEQAVWLSVRGLP